MRRVVLEKDEVTMLPSEATIDRIYLRFDEGGRPFILTMAPNTRFFWTGLDGVPLLYGMDHPNIFDAIRFALDKHDTVLEFRTTREFARYVEENF